MVPGLRTADGKKGQSRKKGKKRPGEGRFGKPGRNNPRAVA